jgi:hypothetical protein
MALISLSEWLDRYGDTDDEALDLAPGRLDLVLISDTELARSPTAAFSHTAGVVAATRRVTAGPTVLAVRSRT